MLLCTVLCAFLCTATATPVSPICDELPRSPSKPGCRLNLSHIVLNELSSRELQDAMQTPAAGSQTAAMYMSLHNVQGCRQRHIGIVCIRQRYIVKWVSRRSGQSVSSSGSSFVNERTMFCRLRHARYMQRLLHFDDDCQVFVMENVLREVQQLEPLTPIKDLVSNQVLRGRHGGDASAVVAYQTTVLASIFDDFRRASILPYDLSLRPAGSGAWGNLLRTDQNGTLTVIDFGMYRLVNVTAADQLGAELGQDARAAPLSLEVAQGWVEGVPSFRSFATQLKWCQQELELQLRRSFGLATEPAHFRPTGGSPAGAVSESGVRCGVDGWGPHIRRIL